MDGGNEQRVSIKFCFKAGLSICDRKTSTGAARLMEIYINVQAYA
jgi:hypothetical protein